jgi:streptogramin lyase
VKDARLPGYDRHRTSTGPAARRRAAVVVSSSAVLASLLYALPAPAASGAPTPTLSEYPAGVGPSAGNGAVPQEVTVGPDGNLWYTDEASGVFRFSPKSLRPLACSSSSTAPGCEVSPNAVAPTGIVTGPDGAIWFTQSNGGNPGGGGSYFPASIGRITTDGAYSSYAVPASASKVPDLDAITVGPNGNLWFTEPGVDRIGEITPRASAPIIHEFDLPAADRLSQGVGSPVTSADTIAAGPDNDVFFTEQGSNAIGVMNSSGVLVSKFIVPGSNLTPIPLGIAESPGGTMWFTENSANQIASLSVGTGQVKVLPLPAGASGPESIVYGPDGNLWFTEDTGVASIDPSTGKVTLYRAHTSNLGPAGVTVGPDCTSIWFTEPSADRIGRVSPIPNTTGCKAGVVPGAGASGNNVASSSRTYTIHVVKPYKPVTVKSSPYFPHGPPHFIVKDALLPSLHPVCLACATELAGKTRPGASPPQPGPLPPYTEPFTPAAMWAQGPLCGTAGANCSYSDWSTLSGHSVGYDGFPDSSAPSVATPLPSIITSPSPTVQFVVPCYFVWDPGDNRPADANGDYYAVGDFLHCEAQIYAATGPATVQSGVNCSVCGVMPGTPEAPEVGSGWAQLASGSVDVGVPGVSTIGTGATEIGTVACNPSATAPPCIIYGKDITLTLFAPGVNTSIVFGVNYYEGDDRPGIESSQPGFSSAGSGPVRLEGYRYPLTGSALAETPGVECDQNNATSKATTCSWQGVSPAETVLCLNSALAGCYDPPPGDLGLDMTTGPFNVVDNPFPPYLQGFVDLPALSIEPTAFVQSDVLVSSIMYQPPGAQSIADYSKKTTNSVQVAVGATSAAGTTSAISDGTTVTYKAGTPSSIGGAPEVGFNFSDASSQGWDTSASATDTSATGSSSTWSSSVGDEWTTKPYTPPVPFNQHESEYWFLGDQYLLALYPQWALWDFMSAPGQGSFIDSLVATGGVQSETVYSLLQCSGGLTHYDEVPASDITIQALPNPIVLGSAECASLLTMDPFASAINQWADLSALESNGRVVSLSNCCSTPTNNATTVQDVDSTSVDKITLSDELNSVDTSSYTAAFTSKVTATVGNTWSVGATLPEGLGGATVQQDESATSGGNWEIDYKNSLTNSQDSISSGSVTLSDNTNPISTQVYLDTTFGTFMFPALGTKPPTAVPCPSCAPKSLPSIK